MRQFVEILGLNLLLPHLLQVCLLDLLASLLFVLVIDLLCNASNILFVTQPTARASERVTTNEEVALNRQIDDSQKLIE